MTRPSTSSQTLPDPIRQPLVAEVLDLATYRFDAWATSLASRRLSELRQERRSGIRLGGYGWVEDLRPGSALQEVVPLPANTSGPLYRSEGNQGYLQAPSLAQAATAAVLRSGYLADRSNGDSGDSPFAVDLSSDRVHRAKWLLDGVRQGQPLGALLGYRFERGLHEQGLDRFIHRFRTLAGLKDEDALTKAYENVRKAEQLASEVAALYTERDQATQRAQDARTLKTERELKRQAYQRELDSINSLEAQANAAAAEAKRLERSIAEHRSRKPVSRVDPANRLYRVELVEEADLEPWTTRVQELAQARGEARNQESAARGAFTVRSGSRAGILAEMARLDNRPANPGSIAAAQQVVDAQEALAKDLDRRGLEKEGTRGRAEQALAAARADLAQQLNRQWARALESLAASNVVDGLELHRRWKAGQRRQPPRAALGCDHYSLRRRGSWISAARQRRIQVARRSAARSRRVGGCRGRYRGRRKRLPDRAGQSAAVGRHPGCDCLGRDAAAGTGGRAHAAIRHRADAPAAHAVSGRGGNLACGLADQPASGAGAGRTASECMGRQAPSSSGTDPLPGGLCRSRQAARSTRRWRWR